MMASGPDGDRSGSHSNCPALSSPGFLAAAGFFCGERLGAASAAGRLAPPAATKIARGMDAMNADARMPTDREMVITRLINAAPARVFDAWTDPEQVVKWWGP